MKPGIAVLAFFILAVSLPSITPAQQTDSTAEVAKRAASYVDGFNRRDVAACTEHWSVDGEYMIAGTSPIVGRKAIGAALEKLLGTDEQFTMTVGNQRFRSVADNVVTEEGVARLVSGTHGVELARYLVVHVKQNGTWYRDSIRETLVGTLPASAAAADLKPLLGHWIHESDAETLTVHADWKHNGRFISREFEFRGNNGQTVTATEMIGWDPATRTVRSWSFDSQGGFEQAVWNHDGQRWLIKVDAVLPNGSTATEQRSLTVDADGNLRTRTLQQQFGGRLMPGSDPVTLVRQSSSKISSR